MTASLIRCLLAVLALSDTFERVASKDVAHLLGVRKPDAGTVRILGMDPQRERRRLFQRVGVQFQEGSHQAEIRVDELCRETACLYGRPADWRARASAWRGASAPR